MARARRRLNAAAMALSIVVHVAVLGVVALHAPKLIQPYEQAGPPEPVIPVLIVPHTPPAPPGATEKPQPIRLHRRQLRPDIPPPDIAPLIVPPKLSVPPPAPARAPRPPRVSVQPSPAQRVTAALRNSSVGCATPEMLSPSERERCNERLGGGAKTSPSYGPTVDPSIARAGAARDAYRAYRDAPVPAGPGGAGGGSGDGYRVRP